MQHLDNVNFTTLDGERVYFDKNGDSPARYELVNLQITSRGTLEGETVGILDASLSEEFQFIMKNISVVWGNGLTEVKQMLMTFLKFVNRFFHSVKRIAHCYFSVHKLFL